MNLLNATHNDAQKPIALILACALFLSPLLFSEALFNPSELPRYVLISIASALTSALLIIRLWRKQTEINWHPINGVIALLAFIATASGLWALDFGGYYLSIVPFIALILIYFVSTHLQQYTTLLLGITLLSALYAAIIGLLQSQNIDLFNYRDANVMGSTFFYKNHAALYFDLVIPASLSLILITKNLWLRWAITVACAICLSYTLETHTRGSWVALSITLIAVLLFLAIQKTRLKDVIQSIIKVKYELFAIALIASSALYSPSKMDDSWSRESYYGEAVLDTSSSIRLSIYKNSLSMLADNPMGVGLGSFWKGFRDYTNYPEVIPFTDATIIIYRAHSEPIQYFLELGLFGGFLVLFIFFYLMTIGIKTILASNDTRYKILSLGICASLLASAAHGLVDFPLHKPSSALQFWVLAGLLVSISVSVNNNKLESGNKLIKSTLAGFSLVTVLITAAAASLYASYIPANAHHQKAVLATDTDCTTAISEIEKALNYSPHYFRTHSSRIDIYFKCVKENEKILPVLNEELAIDETNAKALLKRGYILMGQSKFEAAYQDFSKLKQLLPHRVYGQYGIAQTLLSSGNIEQGLIELNTVIKDHPEFKDAKKQLSDVQHFLKQSRKPAD